MELDIMNCDHVSSAVLHDPNRDRWIAIDHGQPGEIIVVMIDRLSYSGTRKIQCIVEIEVE
jgi:hypothetical protein